MKMMTNFYKLVPTHQQIASIIDDSGSIIIIIINNNHQEQRNTCQKTTTRYLYVLQITSSQCMLYLHSRSKQAKGLEASNQNNFSIVLLPLTHVIEYIYKYK